MRLRKYQQEAHDAILDEWKTKQSTLVVLPTGTGKTVLFSHLIKESGKRAMVIAHREELIYQAAKHIQDAGLTVGIEKAELRADTSIFAPTVVCSSVQTLFSGTSERWRMERFNPSDFGIVVADECFVKGTLVDGIPIEKIKIGNTVNTDCGRGKVTHVFKNKTNKILSLKFSNGQNINCTENHPFFVIGKGWVKAKDLTRKEMMVSITHYEYMQNLRKSNVRKQEALRIEIMPVGNITQVNSGGICKTRRTNNSIQKNKRDVASRGSGKVEACYSCYGMAPTSSGRERKACTNTPAELGLCAWLENGIRCSNKDAKRIGLSALLQIGHRKRNSKDRRGSGWIFSQLLQSESFGQEEGRFFETVRLESIEIYEQRDRERFAKVCPDGFVYNLEVSNGNTYFANGILVHNCHHYTANSYRNVIEYFKGCPNLRLLGVTATPDRADEQALGQIFDSVAFDYEILDAIEDGWLVPIKQQMVEIAGLDFSAMRTTAGDLNGADLARVMEAESNLQGIASATVEIVGDRRTIVFASSVRHAEMLANIFNRHRPEMSQWVCGMTPTDERKQILRDFASGKTQIVCNVGVLTEGFDNPGVACIVQARPTKSRSLYAQMCGRATRPLSGIVDLYDTPEERKDAIASSAKPEMLIIDFAGNAGRHKLMTTADLLGGNFNEDEIEIAERAARKQGKPVDMTEELEKARELLRQRKLQAEATKARLIAKASYVTRSIDPFCAFSLTPVRERGWDSGRTLSEKQRNVLLKMGVNPDTVTYSQGKQLLLEQFRRWDKHLCTLKQANCLNKFGYDTKDMTMKRAGELITALKNNNWRRI